MSNMELLAGDGLANVRDAARFLDVGRSKMYQLLDSGDLPSCRIGKSRKIPWAALKQYAQRLLVESGTVSAA